MTGIKARILALTLALSLALTGCGALLERDYLSISPYEPVSTSAAGPDALRAETYQDMVNAILYLVSEGEEQGILNLYNYKQDVAADLARACQEVSQEDPLGAYAVDYIQYDYSLIVSYYEVNLYIGYRRTQEQIDSIVPIAGNSATRRELGNALASFSPETVMHISYFFNDADYLLDLIWQAYYSAPLTAMGMPEASITIYPESGYQKIVEVLLSYPQDPAILRRRSSELETWLLLQVDPSASADELYAGMLETLVVEENSARSSAYDALIEGVADNEGAALAYQLLCERAEIPSMLVIGQLDGQPHFWNIIFTDDSAYRHVDLSAGLFALTDDELTEAGAYEWSAKDYPVCAPEIFEEEKN